MLAAPVPATVLILAAAAPTVTVHVDRGVVESVSRLRLGVTHTHRGLDQGGASPGAVKRAKRLVRDVAAIQNTHIVGWGVGDINPSPGRYEWSSLDARVELMRSMGGELVMTLCTCPGWMKPSGETWRMEEAPAPEHYDDFARLAVAVARRYPDVRRFQVWNEFKGFWSRRQNNWDGERYTELYNKVYDALKAHDQRLKVGGFYLVVQGDGGEELGREGRDTYAPIGAKDLAVLDHWLEHKRGADFICLDRGVKDHHDPNAYSTRELMRLTHWYGDVCRQVRRRTDLPVWWSEYYGFGEPGSRELAAAYASIYLHMTRSGASAALLWNPNEGEIAHHLFTDVRSPEGGRAVPHHDVFRTFGKHFGVGTRLCRAESSSPEVEVVASATRTLLVNKSDSPVAVDLDGRRVDLGALDVRLIDAPGRR